MDIKSVITKFLGFSRSILGYSVLKEIILTWVLSSILTMTLAVCAITYERKVTDTVGKNITPFDIPGAFVAQLSVGFGVHYFSRRGIPVSTSQAIVGAIIGVGLVRGMKTVKAKHII